MSSSRFTKRDKQRAQRKNRVTSSIGRGNSSRPRLSVRVSNKHVSAQLIDDTKQITLGQVTTLGAKSASGSLTDKAKWSGAEIAKVAAKKKIKSATFDRGQKLYHGRIKAFADSARESGLEI